MLLTQAELEAALPDGKFIHLISKRTIDETEGIKEGLKTTGKDPNLANIRRTFVENIVKQILRHIGYGNIDPVTRTYLNTVDAAWSPLELSSLMMTLEKELNEAGLASITKLVITPQFSDGTTR